MKLDLDFVELHTPLFLNGTNFGLKLYPSSKGGIGLWYDTDLRHTFVTHKNNVAMIETVASMTLSGAAIALLGMPRTSFEKRTNDLIPVKSVFNGKAQVSTPISDTPRKPGRPAKYQGEAT